MEWKPIETSPENTLILTYAPDNTDEPYAIDKWRWVTEIEEEIQSEQRNAKGLRRIIQEVETKRREWDRSWGHEFWMPLPEAPTKAD